MKRFEFNLQTVLDVRRIREDRLRAELAALCHQEKLQEHALGELRRQYVAVHDRVANASETLTGADILAAADAGESLTLAIEDAALHREALANERHAKSQETHAAASQRKMLESLREKALVRHVSEALAATERQVDDLCARTARARVHG